MSKPKIDQAIAQIEVVGFNHTGNTIFFFLILLGIIPKIKWAMNGTKTNNLNILKGEDVVGVCTNLKKSKKKSAAASAAVREEANLLKAKFFLILEM